MGSICSDIGKITLENEEECKNFAVIIGPNGYGGIVGAWDKPTRCYALHGKDVKVYWNTNEGGVGNVVAEAICKNNGSILRTMLSR